MRSNHVRILSGIFLSTLIAITASCSRPAAVDNGAMYPKLISSIATAPIKAMDGTTFTVNDKAGKVILLNMWATWCGPCRSEIPALAKMQDQHRALGFEVIGLNTDEETPEQIAAFSNEVGANYTMAWADTKLQSELLKLSKFPGIPQSFLIDRQGRLRGVFTGANAPTIAKMEQIVTEVMSENPLAAAAP